MIGTSGIRNGLKFLYEGVPHTIVEFQHVKPGKGPAFVRAKLKNLKSGAIFEHKFRITEKIEDITLDDKAVTYTYRDGEYFCFMDQETYLELRLTADQLGDAVNWLTEGLELSILFYNDDPLDIAMPSAVDLLVTHAEPGLKGDTATGATKPVTVETGAQVNVPLFIEQGQRIRIDTRSGEYVTRVKD